MHARGIATIESKDAKKILLSSNDRYCFAISKKINPDYDWLANSFGITFYTLWKQRKTLNIKSGGTAGMGDLHSLVVSAVGQFKKENPYYNVYFIEIKQGYSILCDEFALGLVQPIGNFTSDLLPCFNIQGKGNNRQEYVYDSNGTVVKRFVFRAVGNDADVPIKIFTNSGIYASGVNSQTLTEKNGGLTYKKLGAAGKGAHAPTDSMSDHVMGWKPSIYLSFTTIRTGASNPKGEAFGKISVMIDLMVLKQRGIPFTYLGSAEGERLLKIEIKGKGGASGQAFADIARTKEILVEAWVPPEAIVLIKEGEKILWSRK